MARRESAVVATWTTCVALKQAVGNPWASGGQAADVASNSRRLAANHCTPSCAHLGKFVLKLYLEKVILKVFLLLQYRKSGDFRPLSSSVAAVEGLLAANAAHLLDKVAFERKLHIKDNPSLHLLKVYLANAGK